MGLLNMERPASRSSIETANRWMLAPRRAFKDLPPVEACITQSNCARAVLIHGLGLDLNIAPHVLDALLDNDFDEESGDFEPVG